MYNERKICVHLFARARVIECVYGVGGGGGVLACFLAFLSELMCVRA